MSQFDGGLAGVYPEDEDDRLADLVGDSDYEDDEYIQSSSKLSEDTSSMDVKKGKDIQGIPWDMSVITRDQYRQRRLEQYANFENIPNSGRISAKLCTPVESGQLYYEFEHNTRSVKPTILHFQLRNLLWATTKHDVYLMSYSSVLHWSPLTSEKRVIVDLQGRVAPCEKHHGNFYEGFYQTQVSTLAVKNNLLVAGGFHGELICKFLDRDGISYCSSQHMMTMVLLIVWRYLRILVVLCISWLQIMIVDLKTLTWKISKCAIIFVSIGQ